MAPGTSPKAVNRGHPQSFSDNSRRSTNLPVGHTSVGTGAAEPGFLVVIPSAGVLVSGVIWLFFKGKEIQPNIDAWRALYDKYLVRFFKRRPSFDRGGALILAILALTERLGKDPKAIQIISYNRRSNRMDPHEIVPGQPGEIDQRSRIERATIHVYKIIADGHVYTIHVHGRDVSFIE